jgi:hypothetical protein
VAYDERLAERIRDRLGDRVGVTEKRMFGGLAFLTDGVITVGVYGDDLLVRVNPDDGGAKLAEPGVRTFMMGGRSMRGFVAVAGEDLGDTALDSWIAQAGTYVATLPPKHTSTAS